MARFHHKISVFFSGDSMGVDITARRIERSAWPALRKPAVSAARKTLHAYK